MKYTRFLTILLFLFFIKNANGQNFKADSATRLVETGGIPGASATGYYFKISAKAPAKKVKIDSVWVNNKYLIVTSKNISVTRTNGLTTWRIRVGVHNGKPTGQPANSAKNMNGAAIIYYTYKNKHHEFIVKSITTLPSLNYP